MKDTAEDHAERRPPRRRVAGLLLLAGLAGCSQIGLLTAPIQRYQCAGGSEFRLRIAASGDSANVEFSGMQFNLRAETSTEPGQRFGGDVLTLWRDGDRARIEMDGAQQFVNCRLKP